MAASAIGMVSTHSRLKAAGTLTPQPPVQKTVSTHSRLKAAGIDSDGGDVFGMVVSTHSRLKAAGTAHIAVLNNFLFQHTAA